MLKLTVDLTVEDEAAYEALLGTQHTYAGQVAVAATGTQVGEVCTFEVTGELASILGWLEVLWQSQEEAVQELNAAWMENRVTRV